MRFNTPMDIKEYRHRKFLEALDRYGTLENMAKAINPVLAKAGYQPVQPNYLAQLKKRFRNLGDKTARKLELGCGDPPYSWDAVGSELETAEEITAALEEFDHQTLVQALQVTIAELSKDDLRRMLSLLASELAAR